MGFFVPYDYAEIRHNYEPDFIVHLDNGTMLMLEIKGPGGRIYGEDEVKAKNAAARKWVSAVNNLGRYGQWLFDICEDLTQLRSIVERHAGDSGNLRPFRFVEPAPQNAWKTCVPLTTLKAAAGKFSEEQTVLDQVSEWFSEWITWEDPPRFERGMFVARVSGKSMEPKIPDGAYCLFRPPRAGSRQGRIVLVWHSGITDPYTDGQYTVKVYESEKRGDSETEWRHTRITLNPLNPSFDPIILEPQEEGEVRIVAEFVQAITPT